MTILSADIGGTNSRFGWFEPDGDSLSLKETIWLKTGEADSFEGLLNLLERSGFGAKLSSCTTAVMAVPAAVEKGRRAKPPNIPWDIDAHRVSHLFPAARPAIINDFVAQAFATRTAAVENARRIKEGEAEAEGAVAAIGAGTGLGHCVLQPNPCGGYLALPAEAGHTAFAFYEGRELEYQDFVLKETGLPYAIGDVVVSGGGLSLVHRFLTGEDLEPAAVSSRLEPDSETLDWFARFYGRACRNYALSVLPLGGVYIAGGVAAKNPALVTHPSFVKEFVRSPKYEHVLRSIPMWLNRNEDSGLWGAAYYGVMLDRQGLKV